MSTPFKEINNELGGLSNSLINQSIRNDTIMSSSPNLSTFDKSFQQATTFNSGKLIPILLQECYPGDIYNINVNSIIRLSAPSSTPLMNIDYDINFFFVPFTQIDPNFKELMGENPNYGFSDTNLRFPLLYFSDDTFFYNENDLANYFNIPINTTFTNDYIQIYPFLAYGKVWNDWYRDQNLQSSIDISSVYSPSRCIKTSNYDATTFLTSIIYGKGLAPTSKLPSYFTTCLPYQQKGQPIQIGALNLNDLYVTNRILGSYNSSTSFAPQPYLMNQSQNIDQDIFLYKNAIFADSKINGTSYDAQTQGLSPLKLDLSIASNSTTDPIYSINDLRYSIVSQHLLENWALCGSRYVEQLKSIWGIEIDPKQIDRCELIDGFSDTLIFNNVMQTSQSTNDSQLGKIASNLFNSISNPNFEYAASQHGYIIGVLTCRTSINNGGQGLPKLFKYDDFLDLFNPIFNGISEQPIKNQEIYYTPNTKTTNTNNINNATFGFNEPFLNTKYNIDNANGFLSLKSNTSLFPMFLFGEKYTQTPLLNDNWIQFDPNIINNGLFLVNSSTLEFYHQFIALFTFAIKYSTKQPLFNSPRVYGI